MISALRRRRPGQGRGRRQTVLGLLLSAGLVATLAAQAPPATVREYRKTFTTYPFSDPDPIPRVGRIYPYFRFDGFTNRAERRDWTVVELENTWLRVTILPEIGGKIWSIVDKETGTSIVYDNHVVKFRDIAMRGPWTSGGIEANYGIIGHTPNVATPVDYLTRTNPDGSVSCIIGALDLLTRTSWRLEITLPADKAYVTTSSFWYNATPLEQPYYTWMNAAIPAAPDLEFAYPGNRFIGHGGETGDWPVNRSNGRRISLYRENDFGGYKSYHVFGVYSDFFGGYYHDRGLGMARYAPHDEKPGKKLWIWGLSRQGMIWENLLSDTDGQYVEVQSGRLFNQTADGSTLTPFKHRGFAPHQSDRWTEYWMPVRAIGGMVAASPWGALNVQAVPGGVVIGLSPVRQVADTLVLTLGDRRVYARYVRRRPLEVFTDTVALTGDLSRLRVTLGDHKLEFDADSTHTALSRPVEGPADFDWNTAWGHYLLGKERVRARDYQGAAPEFARSLAVDPNFLPALVEQASLALRTGEAEAAFDLARHALAVDTYDPAANYLYGLAAGELGRIADARDGLDLASQSVGYRGAAWTELARLYLRQGDPTRTIDYASKALDYDRFDLDALQLRAVAHRIRGQGDSAASDLAAITAIDPLDHFLRTEAYLRDGSPAAAAAVTGMIRNEMPEQTLLELGIWYHHAGQDRDAERVLALSADHPEILYWRAWLGAGRGSTDTDSLLRRAGALSPRLVFPFRPATGTVLRWAMERGAGWPAPYYLALVEWNAGRTDAALRLLDGLGETPTFAPFYAARAQLRTGTRPDDAQADWRRAMALDPAEWRYARAVAEGLLRRGSADEAASLAKRYADRAPENGALTTLYARALLQGGHHTEAVRWLERVSVLPAEGAADARSLYREANLLLAVDRLNARKPSAALVLVTKAREWPERLGAGRPYPEDTDERLEDWLAAAGLGRLGRRDEARAALERILAWRPPSHGSGDLVTALALRQLGRTAEADRILIEWGNAAPDDSLARWSRTAGAELGNIPEALAGDVVTRVLRAWSEGAQGRPRGNR